MHYTTQECFLKIVQSGILLATDLRYMNDARELRYGMDLIFDAIEKANPLNLVPSLFAREDIPNYVHVYAACFSARADDLGQWRAYSRGRGGICLHFDAIELRDMLAPDPIPLCKVIYDRDEQERMIESFAADVKRLCSGLPAVTEPEFADKVKELLIQFWGSALYLGATLKDSSFESEHEWRLIVAGGGGVPVVRPGQSTLVPAREIAFGDCLSGLTTGPCDRDDLATHAAKLGLPVRYARARDSILASRIPYRDW